MEIKLYAEFIGVELQVPMKLSILKRWLGDKKEQQNVSLSWSLSRNQGKQN